jgi:ubiquinone/menaquinone biosynthesis C-methylase UbiE
MVDTKMKRLNWKERARDYNKIDWVNNATLLSEIKYYLDTNKDDVVLDAGAGTGVFSKYLCPSVRRIHALDSSEEMLSFIQKNVKIKTDVGKVTKMPYPNEYFDKVIFRNVLHHCVGTATVALEEAYRVLRVNGRIVICEGVPVSDEVVSDFARIVSIKENRNVYSNEDMIRLLYKFNNVATKEVTLKYQSINNWVDNCVKDKKMRNQIKKIHLDTSDKYKKDANMIVTDDDIFVDMKLLIVTGKKT